MIRVIITRQVMQREKMSVLLREVRAAVMPYPGYVSGEILISTEDRNVVAVISTWRSLADWKRWEKSEQRSNILRRIEPILVAPPFIETYEIIPNEELDFLEDPSGWMVVKEHTSFDG